MQPTGYNVHTSERRQELLTAIGLQKIDDLFACVPQTIKLTRPLNTPNAKSEWQIEKHLRTLADKNKNTISNACFLGGGFYDHFIPAVVDAIAQRGEFLTAYTPYQPEMSQGLLQALFEYQQTISKIVGLPVVNSSSYDGATALAEAAWIMTLAQKKSRIAVAESLWTQTQQVLKTYGYGRNLEFIAISSDSQTGKLNLEQLNNAHGKGDLAGVILQSPNCYGVIEDLKAVTDLCKKHNALCTLSYNPWLSSLLKTPGDLGVDIVACEGQVFGLPLSSGGPSLGILATHKELRKFMPGRIIGRVADIYGQPAYAMVHEDREQHVAREKATSNLCSNQALCAIRSVVYLSTLGESGFQAVGDLNLKKSHYLADKLCALKGVSLRYKQPFFNEFLIQMPGKASQLLKFMESKNIFAGIDGATLGITLGQTIQENCLLIAVTENKSKEDLDQYIAYFSEWIKTT